MDLKNIRVKRTIGLEQIEPIWNLRYEILRRPLGQPEESAHFPGDELPTTTHFFVEKHPPSKSDEELIGCATLLQSPYPLPIHFQGAFPPTEGRWYVLRGMAIAERFQGLGIGKTLLLAIHRWGDDVSTCDQGALPIRFWCNAREAAVPFYRRHGWEVAGNPFEIPNVGPHRAMWRPF